MTEIEREKSRLADIINAFDYKPRRRGDGAMLRFMAMLLAGPVRIAVARELGGNLLHRARTFCARFGTDLTVRIDTGCYILAMRDKRKEGS